MGEEICEKQKSATWGDGWLKELSRELTAEFPNINGFSYRNLRNIKQWYQFYNQGDAIWQQPVAKLESDRVEPSVGKGKAIAQQRVAQLGDLFFSVPWGHHI